MSAAAPDRRRRSAASDLSRAALGSGVLARGMSRVLPGRVRRVRGVPAAQPSMVRVSPVSGVTVPSVRTFPFPPPEPALGEDYPFSPVVVMPRIRYFCANAKNSMIGISESTDIASSIPIPLLDSASTIELRATGTVNTDWSVR